MRLPNSATVSELVVNTRLESNILEGAPAMAELRVAASTFPFLYSHSGLDALKHLASQGYSAFELMIFPPHCWPATMTLGERRAMRDWLSDNGLFGDELLLPAARQPPELGLGPIMRRYTLDRYKEAIAFAAEIGCPYVQVAIPGPVNSLIQPADAVDARMVSFSPAG